MLPDVKAHLRPQRDSKDSVSDPMFRNERVSFSFGPKSHDITLWPPYTMSEAGEVLLTRDPSATPCTGMTGCVLTSLKM